jgi:hypothetical protein
VETIRADTPAIKIVNVQGDDEATAALLTRVGLDVYVRQYEMALAI